VRQLFQVPRIAEAVDADADQHHSIAPARRFLVHQRKQRSGLLRITFQQVAAIGTGEREVETIILLGR
jgi:hypothetical protein